MDINLPLKITLRKTKGNVVISKSDLFSLKCIQFCMQVGIKPILYLLQVPNHIVQVQKFSLPFLMSFVLFPGLKTPAQF